MHNSDATSNRNAISYVNNWSKIPINLNSSLTKEKLFDFSNSMPDVCNVGIANIGVEMDKLCILDWIVKVKNWEKNEFA